MVAAAGSVNFRVGYFSGRIVFHREETFATL